MATQKATGTADILVIGGGMAGASAAYFLGSEARVILLERESQPGYHTTGRSAALFAEAYGNAAIRAITRASRSFLLDPPDGFAQAPILTPRGTIFAATEALLATLAAEHAEIAKLSSTVRMVDGDELRRLHPALDPQHIVAGLLSPDDMDIDVHALHWGFLRGLRAGGGEVVTDAEVLSLARTDGVWRVETRAGTFEAPTVVNAAGAWCDEVASMAGAAPVGLVPKRRTAFTFDPPTGLAVDHLPAVVMADESWYVKPEAGRLLGSPADETPSPPTDAQPEELDLAIAVDRIETFTTLKVGRFHSKWAGLRSFVADKTPVAGRDPVIEGLVWCAGQGGYGIQTAAGMGRLTAALALGRDIPADIAALGVTRVTLSPDRPGLRGAR